MSRFTHIIAYLVCTMIISASAQACIQGSVRLQGSSFSRQGRVEVCNCEIWGTVCDDFFTGTSAGVVCSQLGFSGSGAQVLRSGFMRGSIFQQILLDDVRCNGTEDSIFDCRARPIGVHNCRHSEDVGVRCRASSLGDIRLRGRQTARSGRVEVFSGTAWGTVCDDFWSRNDATVACRQLGFPTANATALRLGNGYPRLPITSQVPIVLDNLQCTGSESRLTRCRHNGLGVHNCRHNEDAGLRCGAAIVAIQLDEDESMDDELSKQAVGENYYEMEKKDEVNEAVDKNENQKVNEQSDDKNEEADDLDINMRLMAALKEILTEQ